MPYTTYTLAALIGLLTGRWDGTPFWTGEEARLALNEGLRLWNLYTGTWTRRVVLSPTVIDQVWYAVPGTLTWAARLTINGVPLGPPVGLADLDDGRPGWEAEHTATGGADLAGHLAGGSYRRE
jgi:hypothetical protein